VLTVERRRLRRMVRMRVVVAQHFQVRSAQLPGDAQQIVGRDEISMRIIHPSIYHRSQLQHFLDLVHPAAQHSTAFPGVGQLARATNLLDQNTTDSDRHETSHR
jgi:hypothetical protein